MGKISSVVSLIGMSNFLGLALSTVLIALGACATGPPAPIIDGTKTVDVAPSMPVPTAVPIPAIPSADPGPIITAIENDVQFRAEHLAEKLDEPRERVVDPSLDATKIMLASVDADIAAENFSAAAGSIERAIQISPSDSWAWHKLAKLRFAQGQHAEAKAIARRSNSLSGAGSDVQIANLRLIARIERSTGNVNAAQQAQAQADKIAAEKN
jgi:hypothetical protein